MARRRGLGRAWVVEGRVEREARRVLPLVEALEDQALVVRHGRVPVPPVVLRVAQRVRLARAVREAQLVFEFLVWIDRRLVADGERASTPALIQLSKICG